MADNDLCTACSGTGLKDNFTLCPVCGGTPSAAVRADMEKADEPDEVVEEAQPEPEPPVVKPAPSATSVSKS